MPSPVISPENDETIAEVTVGADPDPGPSTPSLSLTLTTEDSEFDVFLSFRGEDTRKGFTDYLYEALKQRGISTFIDSKNLEKGEEIKRLLVYIEKSKICIPIISEGYADSKWCLKELTHIVECNKKVIPVFFAVNPSDVKSQSGPFASGFEKHESNSELKKEEVRKWRETLTKVGNISGFSLKDTDGYKAKLVQIIIKRIVDVLNPCQLDVNEYIVGHEFHIEKFMRAMDMKSNDVWMVGIHGMGGIGKTTLAKAIYNKILPEFEACSFISNVREAALQPKGLESLQKNLLIDVLKSFDEKYSITDASRGTRLIKERIRGKKVLIILDDVDSRDQLAVLAGSRDWFGEGSRIVITTRDTQPLIIHGVEGVVIYELEELNREDSMKLFCYHAFRHEQPPGDQVYVELCDEAVSSIQGLPLALQVFGSQFFDLKTPKEWRDLLALLKESQHKDIFYKLKLSYESLDKFEKQVFLDIACFFISRRQMVYARVDAWESDGGWNRKVDGQWEVDDATQFWEECGFHPEPVMKVLKHKALIKINEHTNEWGEGWRSFEMHDQIRDMGRRIVEDQEKDRLWENPKVLRALRRHRVPSNIQGIILQVQEERPSFNAARIQELDDLRLLHVYGAEFEGSTRFPEDLKWLGLPNCHLHMPTSVFIPEYVAVLELPKNDDVANILLEKCRLGSTVFDKLKILDLRYTNISTTPDFSCIPCLVKLALAWCKKLREVHESVGKLDRLVWLNLRGCLGLRRLPDTLCKLTSLEFLSLSSCRNLLYLPEQLGDMPLLKHLHLLFVSKIGTLPSSMRKLKLLEHFIVGLLGGRIYTDEKNLVCSSMLRSLSGSLINALPDPCCKSKTQLQLIDNGVEELTDCLTRWENLELLILNCKSLKSLPVGVRQLYKLKVLKVCSNNLILSDDALPLERLENLVLKCVALQHVSPFNRKAENLKHLTLQCNKSMEVLPDWIRSSSNLESLVLRGCNDIGLAENLQQLGRFNISAIPYVFKKLKILWLEGSAMTGTPNFFHFPCLEELTLANCKMLTEVHESIGILRKLESLRIEGCTMLVRLPDGICKLGSLRCLNLKGCTNLSSLPEQLADHMELLEELCLDETGIRSLSTSLGKLTKLQRLSVVNCQFLVNLPESLNFFRLMSTGSLQATSWELMDALPLSCCESVFNLYFRNERIDKLRYSIGRFLNVESMTLRCKVLKDLPDSFGQLKNLKHLTIQCHAFTVDKVCLLESIESLEVECIKVEPLPLYSTTNRTSTGGCENVNEEPPIMRRTHGSEATVLQKLKRIKLCARQISVTPDFSFVPWLEELTLRDCEMLSEVDASIGTLNNLRSLNIIGCNALKGLPSTIWHLRSLQIIELIQSFNISTSLEHLRELELVQDLGLRETEIKSILASIGQLIKVTRLNLRKFCLGSTHFKGFEIDWGSCSLEISGSCLEFLTALSSSLWQSILTLVIIDDKIEVLPDSIGKMVNLEKLVLKCQSLKALPKWIGQLMELDILEVNCDNLTFFGEICLCENIRSLKVRCLHFQPMPSSFGKLKNIRSLELECSSLITLANCNIASLGGLLELSLSGCKNLMHLPDSIRQKEDLERLDLSNTSIVKFAPLLGCLTKLTHLNLSENIVVFSELCQLTSLEEIIARNCHWVEDATESVLETKDSCVELLDLSQSNFRSLPSCINSFSNLIVLNVSGCKELQYIPHLMFPHLVKFYASNCTNLREVPDLSSLQSLRHLFLGGCNSLECIFGFETIAKNIEFLVLPGPSGAIQCSSLRNDFKNKVLMGVSFRRLVDFKMTGNLIPGSNRSHQGLSFLFPEVIINQQKRSLKLVLDGISSPVHMAVMEDDHVLFDTILTEDDFNDKGSKTFSLGEGDDEIFKYLRGGPRTILVSMDISNLSKIQLHAIFGHTLDN